MAAKSQNFVDFSGAQKPTLAKFLEFDFFLTENNITRIKITLGLIHLLAQILQ